MHWHFGWQLLICVHICKTRNSLTLLSLKGALCGRITYIWAPLPMNIILIWSLLIKVWQNSTYLWFKPSYKVLFQQKVSQLKFVGHTYSRCNWIISWLKIWIVDIKKTPSRDNTHSYPLKSVLKVNIGKLSAKWALCGEGIL